VASSTSHDLIGLHVCVCVREREKERDGDSQIDVGIYDPLAFPYSVECHAAVALQLHFLIELYRKGEVGGKGETAGTEELRSRERRTTEVCSGLRGECSRALQRLQVASAINTRCYGSECLPSHGQTLRSRSLHPASGRQSALRHRPRATLAALSFLVGLFAVLAFPLEKVRSGTAVIGHRPPQTTSVAAHFTTRCPTVPQLFITQHSV
jgi:hypothetical protein